MTTGSARVSIGAMQTKLSNQSARWTGLTFVIGGVLMAGFWLIFTSVHGPTSYNENGGALVRSVDSWGSLLGGPPNLLVALGLMLLYPRRAQGASRLARVGCALTLIGLVVPASIDLLMGAIGAPIFMPLLALGLVLLSVGSWQSPAPTQAGVQWLLLIGVLHAAAFALALVPLEISDPFGGYRWYGLLAHFVPAIGWVLSGVGLWRRTHALDAAHAMPRELA